MKNKRKIALIGGFGYILIFITGIFANFNVLETLKVPDDPQQTMRNLEHSRDLFSLGIMAFLVMLFADFLLTWVLWKLFKERNPKLNHWASAFRFVNVFVFGVAMYHLFNVQHLITFSGADEVSHYALANRIDIALTAFSNTWLVGLIFFGAHLMLLSKVLCKEVNIHQSIPVLLFIAGIGYIVDSMLQFTYSNYASIREVSTFIVVLPGLIGELALTFWLLLKGGKNV